MIETPPPSAPDAGRQPANRSAAQAAAGMVPDDIRFNTWIGLSAEHTWQVLTEAKHLKHWFGDHITLDATPGGSFHERVQRNRQVVVTSGRMVRLDRPCLIAMTWADEDWGVETELELTLTGLPDGTLLTLSHSGWQGLSADTAASVRRNHILGWKRHLTHLEAYCSQLSAGTDTGPGSNDKTSLSEDSRRQASRFIAS